MAQQDATEQVKEFLRQVIKYRFWIAVVLRGLVRGHRLLHGLRAREGQGRQRRRRTSRRPRRTSRNSPRPRSRRMPTSRSSRRRPQVVTKDVNKAWKELYDRQAPLLTWPETVQDRFRKWGRKWPETEDSARVQLAIRQLHLGLSGLRRHGLQDLQPLRLRDRQGNRRRTAQGGTAPSAPSSPTTRRPDLGKVWAAQERLWIQHTVLEVVAQVNKKRQELGSAPSSRRSRSSRSATRSPRISARSPSRGTQEGRRDPGSRPGTAAAAEAAGSAGGGGWRWMPWQMASVRVARRMR